MKYIDKLDVNTPPDYDKYNTLMSKINEIIDALNDIDMVVSEMRKD